MKKCNADDHPYCTCRVHAGESACAAGHTQKNAADAIDKLSGLPGYAQLTGGLPVSAPASALHLHFSGYDPRAAGGRQMIKLELRGAVDETISHIEVQLRSELIASGAARYSFVRSLSGQWRPLLIAFSSKNKEYGQYQLEVELNHVIEETSQRRWVCSTVILVPPQETSLTEIHRVFLGSQKNIKVMAEDGSIAKLTGLNSYTHGNMELEISAKNAALTQVELSAPVGKFEIALGSIAWDEELIEESIREPLEALVESASSRIMVGTIATPQRNSKFQTGTTTSASLISNAAIIRLLALDEWVLGRLELQRPSADILLAHQGVSVVENAKLTRRISARHAIIRRTDNGAEIIDVSRYGVLLDGLGLKKDRATPLQAGMRIEFCASIKGIVCLFVKAILPHAVVLQRTDSGEIFYLLTPETRPDNSLQCLPARLPMLFHVAGNFWHSDTDTRQETVLSPASTFTNLRHIAHGSRYSNEAYDDLKVHGFDAWRITPDSADNRQCYA